MEHVRRILAADQSSRGRRLFPVVWSQGRREQLRQTASGEVAGYSPADRILSQFLLLCADGECDSAESGILDVLRFNLEGLRKDGETYISLLNALFVIQRLDLVGAMLRDRFGFPRDVNLAFEDSGFGIGILRWDISADGEHCFVFDSTALRDDNTRNEILNFYWEFPLLAHYAAQGETESGSVLLNRGDLGQKPGLAYCDNRPDYFLIPDAVFVPSEGYRWARHVLKTKQIPWQDRQPVAFWRGATTGMKPSERAWRGLERIRLCEIARAHQHTGLFDVGISGLTQISDPAVAQEIMDSGLVLGRVPWEEWGRYKYLIIIDGNSSPYSNLIQALLTGSPVLRVESSRALRQWFYNELIPWHNYIPIAPDMSDLVEKVRWLIRNDEFARRVGENGRALAETMTIERELQRSVPVISAAFRYFRDPSAYITPYGMQVTSEIPSPAATPPIPAAAAPAVNRELPSQGVATANSVELPPIGVAPKEPEGMSSLTSLLAKKRALEARFDDHGPFLDQNEYMALLRKIDRDCCGILDFRWPGVAWPLYMRCGSSDLSNFGQMFVGKEYGFPMDFTPSRILDLGAYAGYAAAYLTKRFPNAEIVSVEPSPANFQMLTLNTGAYSRIRRLNIAVWGHSSKLSVASTVGGDWGVRLAEADDRESGLPALSIPDILANVGWDRIDYLKCDVEGAELSVFAASGALIAGMVQVCTVETHDAIAPGSSKTVKSAFPAADFSNSRNGEFEVFLRRNVSAAESRAVSSVSVLRPEHGVRPISLTNVRPEGWAYYMFDSNSCQLHPANRNDPAAELATTVELSGQTTFKCELSVENPNRHAVDFIVEVRDLATGRELVQARTTAEAGVRRPWNVSLGAPAYGAHRVMLRTIMSADAPSNHQAFANWIAPCFSG
jgi:FkbM family methyltransferase